MDVPKSLGTVVKLVSAFSDEMTVRTDGKGWHTACMDAARVAMVSIDIPASAFGDYTPTGEFAVRCGEISKLLPKAESIRVEDGWFVMSGKGWTRRTRTLEPDSPVKVPSLALDNTALLSASLMLPVVTEFDAKTMQALHISLSGTGMTLSVGDEKDAMETQVDAADMLSLTCAGDISAAYPLEYWQTFLKALPKDAAVQLAFDSDYPMIVEFGADDMTGRWMVAPRIEQEE